MYFLKQKYEVFETLKVLKDLFENMCGNKIKVLRNENGNDYFINKLQKLCHDSGIYMQHYVSYTPQQNGVAERKNRVLEELSTCLMEEKDLNPKIWDGDINCDAYVHNIYPQRFVRKDSI